MQLNDLQQNSNMLVLPVKLVSRNSLSNLFNKTQCLINITRNHSNGYQNSRIMLQIHDLVTELQINKSFMASIFWIWIKYNSNTLSFGLYLAI